LIDRPGAAWLALCALLALGALLAWPIGAALLDWQPGLAAAQPWRWWSAAWVHLSPLHLLGNLIATALVAACGWAARTPRRLALAWLASWPLTHLALLVRPGLTHYAGLSGVLHAGVAAVAVQLAWSERGARRAVGAAMLAGLSAKLLVEQPWGALVHAPGDLGVPVAPLAHATGTLAGALCAALVLAWRRTP
jgi:rhomboid family GlyGly-CTERM serine protease